MATNNPIRYHSTETKRLLEVTVAGLSSNGIEIDGLGAMKDGKYILKGGLVLTAHAAEQLPLEMGGKSRSPAIGLDERTVSFFRQVNTHSPAGYKGPGTRGTERLHGDVEEYAFRHTTGHGQCAVVSGCTLP